MRAKLSPTAFVASTRTVSPGTMKKPVWVQARLRLPNPGQKTVVGGAKASVGSTVAVSPGSTGTVTPKVSLVMATVGAWIWVENQPGWSTLTIALFGGTWANAPSTPSAEPTRGTTLVWSSRVVPSAAYRLTVAGAFSVLMPMTLNARGSLPGAMRMRKRRGPIEAS